MTPESTGPEGKTREILCCTGSQGFKSPPILRSLPAIATRMDGTYHQQGYGYPHSNPSQLFPVGDAGWGNQVWTAPYVCVVHFIRIRIRPLTNPKGIPSFDRAGGAFHAARGLCPNALGHSFCQCFGRNLPAACPTDHINKP